MYAIELYSLIGICLKRTKVFGLFVRDLKGKRVEVANNPFS